MEANAETWRDVPGFPLYSVSDMGRIKGRRKSYLDGYSTPHGVKVVLYGDGSKWVTSIHRVVLQAFVGDPPEDCVAVHLNGDQSDNRLTNLSYVSNSEAARRPFKVHGVDRAVTVIPDSQSRRWADIPGFPGYRASSDGLIEGATVGAMSPFVNHEGHLVVNLRHHARKRPVLKHVYRLVMIAFIGPQPTGQITLHLDGDNMNNALDNLRYVTRSEYYRFRNNHLGIPHPNHKRTGKNNPGAKELDIPKIQRLLKMGRSMLSIAKEVGVSHPTIRSVASGDHWQLRSVS